MFLKIQTFLPFLKQRCYFSTVNNKKNNLLIKSINGKVIADYGKEYLVYNNELNKCYLATSKKNFHLLINV